MYSCSQFLQLHTILVCAVQLLDVGMCWLCVRGLLASIVAHHDVCATVCQGPYMYSCRLVVKLCSCSKIVVCVNGLKSILAAGCCT